MSLHADHGDATGAYSRKFTVVKELFDQGLLTSIPEEFREGNATGDVSTTQEIVSVNPSEVEEFDMTDGHADHADATGRYRVAYEAKYGPGSLNDNPSAIAAENSWKGFLEQIISEEKKKLNI